MRPITCTSCDGTSYSSSSWKCNDDPSLGNHTIQLDISGYPHIFLRQFPGLVPGMVFGSVACLLWEQNKFLRSSVLNEDNNEARRASRALLHGLSEPEIGNCMCLSRWISVIIMHDVGCMVVVTLTKPLAVGA